MKTSEAQKAWNLHMQCTRNQGLRLSSGPAFISLCWQETWWRWVSEPWLWDLTARLPSRFSLLQQRFCSFIQFREMLSQQLRVLPKHQKFWARGEKVSQEGNHHLLPRANWARRCVVLTNPSFDWTPKNILTPGEGMKTFTPKFMGTDGNIQPFRDNLPIIIPDFLMSLRSSVEALMRSPLFLFCRLSLLLTVQRNNQGRSSLMYLFGRALRECCGLMDFSLP